MTLGALAVLALVLASLAALAAEAGASVSRPLRDGYEVEAAFADASGGAYIILQRGSSADPCHSAPRQTCEKMN